MLDLLSHIIEEIPLRRERAGKITKPSVSKSAVKNKSQMYRYSGWNRDLGAAEAEDGLKQLFIFLGYFCLQNTENQTVVSRGTPPSLLLRLCRMPIRYITDERFVCIQIFRTNFLCS